MNIVTEKPQSLTSTRLPLRSHTVQEEQSREEERQKKLEEQRKRMESDQRVAATHFLSLFGEVSRVCMAHCTCTYISIQCLEKYWSSYTL